MNEHGGGVIAATELAAALVSNIETVVRGKTEEIKLVLTALVCGGHVLLEDVPGTAKTVLARAIAGSVDGATNARIQCTPDLQPTDAMPDGDNSAAKVFSGLARNLGKGFLRQRFERFVVQMRDLAALVRRAHHADERTDGAAPLAVALGFAFERNDE